ncbi:hypothetical protein C8F04DRAFT_1101733 [Mycena alexandri]|uniref:Uncharacterized protein n=1 Tax=Mycena alexandri TaxID=1745969 RepID=A0AAD6SX59_9AGAR|nr:hypothetical protein C8F04DRAFT_1101733 [Mycena alexandri]
MSLSFLSFQIRTHIACVILKTATPELIIAPRPGQGQSGFLLVHNSFARSHTCCCPVLAVTPLLLFFGVGVTQPMRSRLPILQGGNDSATRTTSAALTLAPLQFLPRYQDPRRAASESLSPLQCSGNRDGCCRGLHSRRFIGPRSSTSFCRTNRYGLAPKASVNSRLQIDFEWLLNPPKCVPDGMVPGLRSTLPPRAQVWLRFFFSSYPVIKTQEEPILYSHSNVLEIATAVVGVCIVDV